MPPAFPLGRGPAGGAVAVDDVFGFRTPVANADLSIGSRPPGELHRLTVETGRHLAEKEVPPSSFVVRPARTTGGEPVVGERFQPQRGQRFTGGGQVIERERQLEDVPFGDVSGGEDRAILLQDQPREIGLHVSGAQRHPRSRLGLFCGEPRLELLFQMPLPAFRLRLVSREQRELGGERLLQLFDLLLDLATPGGDGLVRQDQVGLVRIVEQCHQPEVFGVGNRIVLVRVTLGTPGGQSHPHGPGRRHAIDHGVVPEFERVDPPFLVEHRVAMEPGGDPLVGRRLR